MWITEDRLSGTRLKEIGHVSDCFEVLYTNDHDVDCTSIFSNHRECKEEGYSYVGGTQFNRQAFVS